MGETNKNEVKPHDLEGKKALVTGASRGIGEQIAFTLADYGVDVVVNYNTSHEKASETATNVELEGEDSWVYPADISDYEEVKQMKDHLQENFGEIDILVNNAGINRDKFFAKMKKEEWDDVLSVNLNGVFNCSKVFLDDLRESEQGRIINISSVVGQKGNKGQVNYASSKAGIIGFTKALAQELVRDDVTVNAVAPGFIATQMVKNIPEKVQEKLKSQIPMSRFGEPIEVAEAVAFLASAKASYMTGTVLEVNGGYYL
ncbi:MAG: 3-oxoacyl-[acyl-carrier-protein] reductase [Candidatus Thermoplasmatota archaeon]